MPVIYESPDSSIFAGKERRVAHVYFESGQSNAQGVADASDSPIPLGQLIGNVKTWRRNTNGGDMYTGIGQWYGLEYATNQYEGRNQFGSVLQFAINLRNNTEDANNDIYIVKADGNGKPIAGWLNGGNEAIAMYDGHFGPALAELKSQGIYDEIRIHGFFWHQGEGDSDTSLEANAHQTNLTTLISNVRTYLGIPDLPFIIARTESTLPSHSFVSVVASAQEAIAAADSNVEIITGPFSYVGDLVHLDGPAQNSIGNQRYTLLNSMNPFGSIYNG